MADVKNSNDLKYNQLEDAFTSAIGKYVILWSHIDFLLGYSLGELSINNPSAEVNENFAFYTVLGMESRVKIGLIKTLLTLKLGDIKAKQIIKSLEKLERLKEHRDIYVHGLWAKEMKTGQTRVRSMRAVGKITTINRIETLKSIQDTYNSLLDAMNEYVTLISAFGYLKKITLSKK